MAKRNHNITNGLVVFTAWVIAIIVFNFVVNFLN